VTGPAGPQTVEAIRKTAIPVPSVYATKAGQLLSYEPPQKCHDVFLGRKCDLQLGHSGYHAGGVPAVEPPPESRFDFINGLTGDVLGPLFSDRLISRYARSLFELDFDEHAIRVGDEGRGGIGKAAVLARMWERASEETRSTYEWRAAIVLKRSGELS
jgi:hypothetical protein